MSLRLYLLGQFNLYAGDSPVDLPSRPAQSLLAYLALSANMTHRRERLAGLLWPDSSESNARGYLRQALWRIRKALEGAGLAPDDYLHITDVNLTFNRAADYWLDTEQLLRNIPAEATGELAASVGLYRGELLPGFYDEWIEPERERLEAAYQQKMNVLLAGLLAAGRWSEAVERAEQWLRLGHAPEPAFRALMRAHAGLGDMAQVSAAYRRCVDVLERELGLEPSAETRRLAEQLLRGESPEAAALPEANPIIVATTQAMTEPARRPPFLDDQPAVHTEPPLFVARESELAQLAAMLDRAVAGQGRVSFVIGEAGSGKTSLLNALAGRAMDSNPDLLVISGSCNAYTGAGDPYLPFREALEMLTGEVEGRWEAGVIGTDHARRLWNSLSITAEALVDAGPDLVNTFLNGPALLERVDASLPEMAGAAWRTRLSVLASRELDSAHALSVRPSDLFEQYSRVLQAISRRLLLLLVVDDLQWADPGSLSLLFHLGRHLAGSRILIVGAYRPEEVALGRDGARHPLEPVVNELQRQFGNIVINLDQSEGRDFVEALVDSEPNQLGPSFRYMIYRQTQGNPLFTIELLRGMQDRGDLTVGEQGQWIEGSDLDWETLPVRVEAVIAERIGRLAPPLQAALQVASVEGDVFTAEVVARVQGADERALLAALGGELDRQHQLVHAQSIVRREGRPLSRYRFRHNLFQKYLYNRLNEVERVHLHEQVGVAIEELYGAADEVSAMAPQLARHFEEAQVTAKAVRYLTEAGRRAVQICGYDEANAHLTRGLALLATLPPTAERDSQELALLIALAITQQVLLGAQSVAVAAICDRALELQRHSEDTEQLSQILGILAIHNYVRAEYEASLTYGKQALRVAEQADDPLLVGLSHWYMALVFYYQGRFTDARAHFAPLLAMYDPEQHRERMFSVRGSDAALSAKAYDACCLWVLGYPDRAAQMSREALAAARDLNHFYTLADVVCYGGCVFNEMRRDADALLSSSSEFLKLVNSYTLTGWAEAAEAFQGVALILSGRASEGVPLVAGNLAASEDAAIRLDLPDFRRVLAEGQAMTGDVEAGLASIDQVLSLTEETGDFHWAVETHRVRAGLLLVQGDAAAAEHSLLEAIALARQQEAKSYEMRATVDLARLWQAQGRTEEARATLAAVYDWFTEGFDEPDLVAARELLTELT